MSNRFHTVEDALGQEFYQLPKDLIKNKHYKNMSANSKIAYAILKDRHSVSLKNRWFDEHGRVYFLLSDNELAEILDTSVRSASRYKNELQSYGLIHMERQGLNKRNRIYLLKVESELTYTKKDETTEIKDKTKLSSPEQTKLSSPEQTKLSNQERTELSTLSNTNSSKNDFSKNDFKKNDDELYIYKLRSENVIFELIFDFLIEKGLSEETANETILKCNNQNINLISATDIENQYDYMMKKHNLSRSNSQEPIQDFAGYFVGGLKKKQDINITNSLNEREKALMDNQEDDRKVVPFYNWLEEKSN